ncbi:unnamed protein product [Periconia digitata]|uniref:Uncharacterized protein n=1 Tax=Periconia digitata TaxID=1303443 RepID=A0A9W4XTA3_9PLEO|nr:unnamed protein product [Periconia digitata]
MPLVPRSFCPLDQEIQFANLRPPTQPSQLQHIHPAYFAARVSNHHCLPIRSTPILALEVGKRGSVAPRAKCMVRYDLSLPESREDQCEQDCQKQ